MLSSGVSPSQIVDALPEPTALVAADGIIHAANAAFARACCRAAAQELAGTRLCDHLADAPSLVDAYVRRCAGTRRPLPGALTLRAGEGTSVRVRCHGWMLRPSGEAGPALVMLRLAEPDADTTRFSALAQQIDELTAEVERRQRIENQLAAALNAQTRMQQRFALLAEAPAVLLSSLALEDVHRELGLLARRMIDADAHAVWQYDSPAGIWRAVWQDGLSERFTRELTTFPDRVPFEDPIVIGDVTAVPLLARRRETFAAEGIVSVLIVPLRIRNEKLGALVAYFRRRIAASDDLLRVATALGNMGSSAITTATIYEHQTRMRRDLEIAEHRARFLARAANVLAGSLHYEDTLRSVAKLAVPEVADWCAVDIVGDSGEVRRVAVAHIDPSKVQLARILHERYPDPPEATHSTPYVLRTASSIMMSRIPQDLLLESARSDEHREILRTLGLKSYMSVPMAVDGRAIGVITFVSAESGREYTEDDLRFAEDVASRAAMAVEKARAYEEARRANQIKDEFLATLSHELRTPLNAVLGYVRMLRTGVLPPERHAGALETVERNATSLSGMVEDILDVSRVVAGHARLDVQPVDLPRVVRDAVATVTPAAEAKGVRLQCVIDLAVPTVTGDPARLQQVVWNLLSNAVKFTPQGGRVETRVQRAGPHVEITVRDTGIGIPPAFLPYVFDRFRQADSRFSREHGGLGLGLSIAKHFVELHGGEISVDSAGENRGTTFRVTLPTMIVHHEPERRGLWHLRVDAAAAAAFGTIPGIHVLAVDDEPDSRTLLAEVLQAAGAKVTLAASAREALQVLEREMPHVIVTDIGMPGMDGFEFVAHLRQASDARRTLPIAALTAYARSEERLRALECGFQMHLSKPISPSELVAAVRILAGR